MFNFKKRALDSDGVISIEFALIVVPFIITILFIMEFCRYIYVTSSVDMILAESSSEVASLLGSVNRDGYFRTVLLEKAKSIPLLIVNDDDVASSMQYCSSLEQLIDGACSSSPSKDVVFGFANIDIEYRPLFFPFYTVFPNQINKKTIVFFNHESALKGGR